MSWTLGALFARIRIRGLDQAQHGVVQAGRERRQVRALVSVGDHGDIELVGVGEDSDADREIDIEGNQGERSSEASSCQKQGLGRTMDVGHVNVDVVLAPGQRKRQPLHQR